MKWFLCGILIGFIGNFADNFYWTAPWTTHYLGLPESSDLTTYGVFPNIVFRQGLTLISAYCHLRAFTAPEHKEHHSWINRLFFGSVIVGQLFVVALIAIKYNKFDGAVLKAFFGSP